MTDEMNEFTPDLFTLEDEDGNEQEFELLDSLEMDGVTYYALMPYHEEQEEMLEEDGEFIILKTEEEDGEEILVTLDEEDEEFQKIGELFLKRLNEIFDEYDDVETEDDGAEEV